MIIEVDILNEEYQGQSTVLELCAALKQLSVSMSDAKAVIKEYLVFQGRRDPEIESMMEVVEHEWLERNPGRVTDKGPVVSGLANVLSPPIMNVGGSDEVATETDA